MHMYNDLRFTLNAGHDAQEAALIDQWLEFKVSHLDRCTNEKELHNALQVGSLSVPLV